MPKRTIQGILTGCDCELDDISTLLVDREGNALGLKVGCPHPDYDLEDGWKVGYTRGLLPAPHVERRFKTTNSRFRLRTPRGLINVPISQIQRTPEWEDRFVTREQSNGPLPSDDFLKSLTSKHVYVVWVTTFTGAIAFQWYIVRECDKSGILNYTFTRIPHEYETNIIENSIAAGLVCPCGRCEHPLKNLRSPRVDETNFYLFENICYEHFSTLQRIIVKEKAVRGKANGKMKAQTCVPELDNSQSTLTDMEPGVCSVCLEDCMISRKSCPHQRCQTEICKSCNEKLRGLCAVCDRNKLSSSRPFICFSCKSDRSLESFGHPCSKCNHPSVCRSCYDECALCLSCLTELADNAMEKHFVSKEKLAGNRSQSSKGVPREQDGAPRENGRALRLRR